MKKFSILVVIAFLFSVLTSCVGNKLTPLPTIDAGSISTFVAATLTALPSSTARTASPTPEPSLTIETPITPTPEAPSADFLATLNLNPDRNYSVIDNYYVDSYNGAKLAKLDKGVWVETTLEEKYGFMAPLFPEKPYIGLDLRGTTGMTFGDNYHASDKRYVNQELHAIWTGDHVVNTVTFQGDSVREEDGIFVLRDNNGILHSFLARLQSPDVEGLGVMAADTGAFPIKVGDLLVILPLGKQVKLTIYYDLPLGDALQPHRCSTAGVDAGVCTDEYNAALLRAREQIMGVQTYIDSLKGGKNPSDDYNLILVPAYIDIRRDSS